VVCREQKSHDECIVVSLIDTVRVSGPARGLMQLARLLPERQVSIQFLTFSYPHLSFHDFSRVMREYGGSVTVIPQRFRFDPLLLRCVREVIKDVNPHIIQTHSFKMHFIVWLLRISRLLPKIRGKSFPKWIIMEHGFTSETKRVIVYNFLTRVLAVLSDKLILVSETQKKYFPYSTNSVVIPNAVDKSGVPVGLSKDDLRSQLGISSDDIVVIVVGRLSAEKGQGLVLEALNEIAIRNRAILRGLRVLIIGEGPDKQILTSKIQKFALNDIVTMLPFSPEIGSFYEVCDFLWLPSISEGLPNVVLEAAAFGKASLAASVGSVPQVVIDGETGLLFPPGDVSEMANKLEQLLMQKDLFEKFGNAARILVETSFSPFHRADTFKKVYQALI
jgi:glycosyltransferase involved in cell wall biosynthesis